ncbi:MAG: hypothetical protein ABL883_12930 [Terricaulis sp.]
MGHAKSQRNAAAKHAAQGQLDLFAVQSLERRSSAPKGQRMTMPVKEALHRYGIGRTKLYELLGTGALKASKLGAKTLIDVECADTFFGGLPSFRGRSR